MRLSGHGKILFFNFCRTNVLRGDERMILDNFDSRVLTLCGLCRYIPTGLSGRFKTKLFNREMINNLQVHGLVKLLGNGKSFKLTYEGLNVLAEMGYSFAQDNKTDTKRKGYGRKLKNAELNILLDLAGIEVTCKEPGELAGKETGYITSLASRADGGKKALAGTRFAGILKLRNTAYIAYVPLAENEWLIPGYEREIFLSQVSAMGKIRNVCVLLAGTTLDELYDCLMQKGGAGAYGRRHYRDALEEMGTEYALVPLNASGVIQMRVMSIPDYEQRILNAVGDINSIVGIDMNIGRIKRGLGRIKGEAKLVCMTFQKNMLLRLLAEFDCPKCTVAAIDEKGICGIFPEITEKPERKPYLTKEGKYIEAAAKNTKALNANRKNT